MKRTLGPIEPWSTKEKLCLCVAVLRSGDQNWMSVSRQLRVFGEPDKPPEWYSQKQCAQQYEALISNINTSKRKKRNEKGVEKEDTPAESIVRKMLEERLDELQHIMEEERKEYARIKQEIEDIESGRADDRLEEFEREMEEELEREAAGASILRQYEDRSKLDCGKVIPVSSDLELAETKVPTSPLLTSLLQSPTSYRGSMHNLLHPTPPISRVTDSPTLSRLLESPSKQLEPTVLFPTPAVKKEPVEEESTDIEEPSEVNQPITEDLPEVVEEVQLDRPIVVHIKHEEEQNTNDRKEKVVVIVESVSATQVEDMEVEIPGVEESNPVSISTIKDEDADGEKEDLSNPQESSFNILQDSDTIEEQQSITELDRQMVNMIVAGTGVISVIHNTLSDHLEDASSAVIQVKEGSTADNSLEEEKTEDVEHDADELEGSVVEMVNLEGAGVVEEEADTTVHEVEVLEVSELNTALDSAKSLDEEDESTQDGEVKAETPETDPQESQEEVQVKPSSVEMKTNEGDNAQKDSSSGFVPTSSRNIIEVKVESPSVEEYNEGSKRPTKKRFISGSDSKPSSPACHLIDDSKEYRSWKKSIMLVFNRMATHKYASIFLRPITNEQAPAYDTVIQRPIDLSTIKKRIESGELRTTLEFQKELLVMFQNAIMYNNYQTLVYDMASVMKEECMQHIELMVEAMGEGVPWQRDSMGINKLPTRGRGEAPKRKRTSTVEDSKFVSAPKIKKEPI